MVNGCQIVFYIKKEVKIKRRVFLRVILLGNARAVDRSLYHDGSVTAQATGVELKCLFRTFACSLMRGKTYTPYM